MSPEFSLIRRYFTRPARHTRLTVGDDAAVFAPHPGSELAVSTDTLVVDNHFFADANPVDLGWKTLAVNISDIAAMGALPRWALLAVTFPGIDETWISSFSRGFFSCADTFDVDLVGGDVTRGPLNLSVTILGEVPAGQSITRAGARINDDIWITGYPGRAALGLAHLQGRIQLPENRLDMCLEAFHRPMPRVVAGQALRNIASAMLDVSDGLLGDLTHILEQSHVGAVIHEDALPLASLAYPGAPMKAFQEALLSGGDDYELLFCAGAEQRADIVSLAEALDLPFTRIGAITDQPYRLLLRDTAGHLKKPAVLGYDHFR